MKVDNKYERGTIVFLKTDDEQKKRMITAIKVCLDDSLIYQLSCGVETTEHFEEELSTEKDLLMTLNSE